MINAIGFSFSENLGKFIENCVAVELKRRGDSEIYYWKDYQNNEVDFVIKDDLNVKELIQVTYANSFDEVKERELKSLIKASEELKCDNLTIIDWDYEEIRKYDNKEIKFIPLWKWLLYY